MADFLLYWKEYWKYFDESDAFTHTWETKQANFYNRVKKGDSLWIVISGGNKNPDKWLLLEKIIVSKKLIATKNISQYGKHEIIGDKGNLIFFDFYSQKDFANILYKLEFESGKKIKAKGRAIGNAIQTIRPLSEDDSFLLKDYIRNLKRHSTDVGYEDFITADNSLTEIEKEIEKFVRKGVGFGNPETNRKVEKAAISVVENAYKFKGWKVKSVEAEKCGYDLLCLKGSKENHIEVKGVQGILPNFIITANEAGRAESDKDFIICIVTSALSSNPKLHSYTSKDFIEKFDRKPLAFRATLRVERGKWGKSQKVLAKAPNGEAEDYDKI